MFGVRLAPCWKGVGKAEKMANGICVSSAMIFRRFRIADHAIAAKKLERKYVGDQVCYTKRYRATGIERDFSHFLFLNVLAIAGAEVDDASCAVINPLPSVPITI
jgi:hypothetical protein